MSERERPPYGYRLEYANDAAGTWLVMRWGVIVGTFPTLAEAYAFLCAKVAEQ